MEKAALYCLLNNLTLHVILSMAAVFTEIPKDVSVGEGEDVEMPCAFQASSAAHVSLEIQWWYLKDEVAEQQISSPDHGTQIIPREATKISTVRVQGNAISHRLSLSRVKKEDEGVYECRVSDLWASETQEFTVHAALHVSAGKDMVAEEAVSHIQNRWPSRNANTVPGSAGAGRGTSEPCQALADGQRSGQGKYLVPRLTQPGLLASGLSSTAWVAKSSAPSPTGTSAILQWHHTAGSKAVHWPVLCVTLLVQYEVLSSLLAH
ncbi:V-set and transmembrane domain-containing protein 2B [Synchiropus splendidus]|uniref:V-set and transmembrane domain-containing protein 2B n=1 Tax=Synchiropus splendidus TaxID=270530 RepID=UPI00237D6598|nr:V-set and transmembrane domain-containing protein 2B [Synchiropus splendidus]